MAESLGPIDTGYTPARPTDDLAQVGAGLKEAQRVSLINQMQTRTQDSIMSAANVSSQIADRSRQTDAEIEYKNNLVDMNISRNQREQEKLPYELRGLAASSWVTETIARGNELKNHLSEATMAYDIEQEALQIEQQHASLQDVRQRNEIARRQIQTETENRPKFNDYWDRVDAGEINPEESPRPDYGGNRQLSTDHDNRMRLWRGNQEQVRDAVSSQAVAAAEGKELSRMSAVQRKAYDDSPNESVRSDRIYQAKRTNDILDEIREAHPEGREYIDMMGRNQNPITKAFPDPPIFDKHGSLTNEGHSLANIVLRDAKRASSRDAYAAKMGPQREAQAFRLQQDAIKMAQVREGKRADFIQDVAQEMVDRNAEERELDESVPAISRADAIEEAGNLWPLLQQSAAGPSAAGGAGGASTAAPPDSDYLSDVPPEKTNLTKGNIEAVRAFVQFIRTTADESSKNYEKSARGSQSVAGMTDNWGQVAVDRGAWIGGMNIDVEGMQEGFWEEWNPDTDALPSPVIQKNQIGTTSDYNSVREGFRAFVSKLRKANMNDSQIIDATQPHPAHLQVMGIGLPFNQKYAHAYIDDGSGHMQWIEVPRVGNVNEQLQAAAKIAQDLGKSGKIWLEGKHFTRDGKPTGTTP